jgi:hypothetical protein
MNPNQVISHLKQVDHDTKTEAWSNDTRKVKHSTFSTPRLPCPRLSDDRSTLPKAKSSLTSSTDKTGAPAGPLAGRQHTGCKLSGWSGKFLPELGAIQTARDFLACKQRVLQSSTWACFVMEAFLLLWWGRREITRGSLSIKGAGAHPVNAHFAWGHNENQTKSAYCLLTCAAAAARNRKSSSRIIITREYYSVHYSVHLPERVDRALRTNSKK